MRLLLWCRILDSIPTSLLRPLPLFLFSSPSIWTFMMHPKPVITNTTTKRGHTCTATTGTSEEGCPCGPVSKRPACSGGDGGGEDPLSDSLFSLVTVAEQQRQAQERGGEPYGPANHLHPLSCSAPATLTARQTIYPPAGKVYIHIYSFYKRKKRLICANVHIYFSFSSIIFLHFSFNKSKNPKMQYDACHVESIHQHHHQRIDLSRVTLAHPHTHFTLFHHIHLTSPRPAPHSSYITTFFTQSKKNDITTCHFIVANLVPS